jgi:hypothetical protein
MVCCCCCECVCVHSPHTFVTFAGMDCVGIMKLCAPATLTLHVPNPLLVVHPLFCL